MYMKAVRLPRPRAALFISTLLFANSSYELLPLLLREKTEHQAQISIFWRTINLYVSGRHELKYRRWGTGCSFQGRERGGWGVAQRRAGWSPNPAQTCLNDWFPVRGSRERSSRALTFTLQELVEWLSPRHDIINVGPDIINMGPAEPGSGVNAGNENDSEMSC